MADVLKNTECCKVASVNYDPEYSTYTIDLDYELNGVSMSKAINWEYLTGPLFARVNEAYEKLKEYPSSPYKFSIGQDSFVIEDERDIVSILYEKVKKGVYIQRYKGLGEMNPEQLWETTMNPENRTILKVEINDFLESETIFDSSGMAVSSNGTTFPWFCSSLNFWITLIKYSLIDSGSLN